MAGRRKKRVGSFESKARQIAKKQGIPVERGRAILATGARRASAAAKRKNLNLLKVSGVKKRRRS